MLPGDWGYVVAGYALTLVVIGAYVVRLSTRARNATRLIESLRRRQR